MSIDEIRKFCLSLPFVKEDVKWGNDLCFLIGEKMFCVARLDGPFGVSIKVKDEEFNEIIEREGFIPAPYLARYKWIHIENAGRFNKKEWEFYLKQSYELIKSKLPKKILSRLK